MSGSYRHLAPGRYQLDVDRGQGPAGVRRPDGRDVVVGVNGGTRSFALDRSERVYYWWRGPRPRPGVRLVPRELRDPRELRGPREDREPREEARQAPRLKATTATLRPHVDPGGRELAMPG